MLQVCLRDADDRVGALRLQDGGVDIPLVPRFCGSVDRR
jgi:hypothetical protein